QAAPAVTTPTVAPATAANATSTPTDAKAPRAETRRAASIKPELRVTRLVVATGVSHREPEGVATLFRQSETDKLYAVVEGENKSREAAEITVSFEPPDGRVARGNVSLDVGSSPRWRTWAYSTNVHQVGSWTAVVKDADGHTLARQPFEIAL